MNNNAKRETIMEDNFIPEKSKLNAFFDDSFDEPRFLVIHLTNRIAQVRKEIKTAFKSNEIEMLTLNLFKENSMDYELKVESFLAGGPIVEEGENDKRNTQMKAILFSGLKTDTKDKITADLLIKWNEMSNKNCWFIFLVASENTHQDLQLRMKDSNVEAEYLDLRSFTDLAKSHLGLYKNEVLKISQKGQYMHKGNEHEFDYILPKGSEEKNVLPYKDNPAEDILKDIDLHRYYYHLNSSQIMCINFFYPLIKEGLLDYVLTMLGIEGEVDYSEFEKDSEVENANYRKTKFDFYIRTKDGKNIFFEIKYTENEFGKAKDDEEHQKKFTEVYEPKLNKTEVINSEFKTKESFFNNYQIIRNVMNIDENSYVVFVYPKENKGIRSGVKLAKNQIINKKWQEHFKPILWSTLTDEILLYLENHKELKEYYENQFSRKYLR